MFSFAQIALLVPLMTVDGGSTCSSTAASARADKDLVQTAQAAGTFKTLTAALDAAKLVETLKGSGPFTVFAPTDAAFAALPAGTVDRLLLPENRGELAAVLTYHVVPGRVMAADVVKLDGAVTVNGQRVDISASEGVVRVDGARVTSTDIACSNGVIHVIDAVILPAQKDLVATAGAAGKFKTLLAAAQAAGLAETLAKQGPFTIFAPTDAAFDALPKGAVEDLLRPENREKLARILKHHVVSGRVYAADVLAGKPLTTLAGTQLTAKATKGEARIGDAKIAKTDIDAGNGVIHVIESVLMPAN